MASVCLLWPKYIMIARFALLMVKTTTLCTDYQLQRVPRVIEWVPVVTTYCSHTPKLTDPALLVHLSAVRVVVLCSQVS